MKSNKQIAKELNEIANRFDTRLYKLNDDFYNTYNSFRRSGQPHYKAFVAAMAFFQYGPKLTELVLQSDMSAINARYIITNPKKMSDWVLKKVYPQEKITFPATIQNNLNLLKSEVKDAVKDAVKFQNKATKLINKGKIEAELPKYLKDLIKLSRESGISKEAAKAYKRAVKKALRNIENLAADGAPTEHLKKAYKNLLKKVTEHSDKALKAAIQRAIKVKAKEYGQRVQRTEIIRMNTATRQIDLDNDKDAKGWKSNLHPQHEKVDECDFHATADLFGLGAGVQPVSVMIQNPWHTKCFCTISFVYKTKKKNANFNRRNGIKWLKANPSKAKGMMTKENYKKFLTNPNDWPDLIQGWDKMYIVPRIPKSYLGDRK